MLNVLVEQLTSVGAPIYIALLAVSIAATSTVFYKIVQFARLGVGRRFIAESVLNRWRNGDADTALRQAVHANTAMSRVMAATMYALMQEPGELDRSRDAGVAEAMQTLDVMTKSLRILEATVQAAPMLGLLGTVIGMIKAFSALGSGAGAVDPGALANGIWVALLTTAIGLAVAIPFYFLSVWLEGRVDRERSAMEQVIEAVIAARPAKRPAAETRTAAPFRGQLGM